MEPLVIVGFLVSIGLFANGVARTASAAKTEQLREEIDAMRRLLKRLTDEVETLKGEAGEPEPEWRKRAPETAAPPAPEQVKPEVAPPVSAEPKIEELDGAVVYDLPKPDSLVLCGNCGARWPAGTWQCRKCWALLKMGEEIPAVGEEKPEQAIVQLSPTQEATKPKRPVADWIRRKTTADREWLKKVEEAAGRRWITWVGAVVLFLSAAFFVKYAFDHGWLGPTARVILGVIVGLGALAAGDQFLRRKMLALGQGLTGAGLAILYVSLYAAYGFFDPPLLSQPLTFILMAVVTAGGMVLSAVHNALPISFLAALGGFLTPALFPSTGDPRDLLFAYILLLDLGILGLAFFRRWRAHDVLAFMGTAAYFTGWYFRYYSSEATTAATLWLGVFYVVFLIQPFVYHLRLATPIVRERFALAVSNAAGMFLWAYKILYQQHKHALALITLGMSASYLALGALTRRRIKTDRRAVLGFIALSIMFVTAAVPIYLDFNGVTVTWAIKAPVLLYLAYRYAYFPARVMALAPLALAAVRIFAVHWPLHKAAFTPVFNSDFGTAILVAAAGGAYAVIHHLQRKNSSPTDQALKVSAGIGSAFLALVVMHIEVWQWLKFSGNEHFLRWAAAFVWVAGSAGFLAAGMKLRSYSARASGLVALVVAGILESWDYALGIDRSYLLIFNGRFLAALAAVLVVFSYAFIYRRSQEVCRPDEKDMSLPLYGVGIGLLVILASFETWQWLTTHDYYYMARCLLPFLWVAGATGYLGAGIRLQMPRLRVAGLAILSVAGILAARGYAFDADVLYPYLNGRFLAAVAVVLMVFAYGFILRRLPLVCKPEERKTAKSLYGIAVALLLILLSVETCQFFLKTIADPKRARWAAQMSLSILWSVYATVVLAIGFRRKVRSLRLSALGLFGLTALKVVILDMAKVGEVYRIVSFLVLGVLMIGASYLYHRVEKRLEGTSK
jgi:hypothetical protein